MFPVDERVTLPKEGKGQSSGQLPGKPGSRRVGTAWAKSLRSPSVWAEDECVGGPGGGSLCSQQGNDVVPLAVCGEGAVVKPGQEPGAIQASKGSCRGRTGWLVDGYTREFQDKPGLGT